MTPVPPAPQDPFRVLRELVHVDDVGDRPQLVDRLERPPPLDPALEREQEEDARAHEHDVVDARLERLHEVEEREGLVGESHLHDRAHEARDNERDERTHGCPQGEDRTREPGGALDRPRRDLLQLPPHAGEARIREPHLDPQAELGDRVLYVADVEPPVRRLAPARLPHEPGD
jgi:hypothetical protein